MESVVHGYEGSPVGGIEFASTSQVNEYLGLYSIPFDRVWRSAATVMVRMLRAVTIVRRVRHDVQATRTA